MSAPARWSVQHEALHADCKVFRVFKEHFNHPLDKREGDFFVLRSNDWVIALPLTDDGRLVMVRQFRFGCALQLKFIYLDCVGTLTEHGDLRTH